VGEPEGKRPLGRPIRRLKNNIKMDLREIVYYGMDWIDLAHDGDQCTALINAVRNFRFQWNIENFFISPETGGFSKKAQLPGVGYVWHIDSLQDVRMWYRFNWLKILSGGGPLKTMKLMI
jgi:hypothetical protein